MSHKSLDTAPRLTHVIILTLILSCFLILSLLRANPEGFGSHRTLGLPPCIFLSLTGIRCPSCGLTTSVVQILHGKWLEAWRANPTGYLVFFSGASLILASLYGLCRPFRWGDIVARSWFHIFVMCGIGFLFGSWIMRIFSSPL